MMQSAIPSNSTHRLLARDIFRELIEIDTTDESGDVTNAAEAMAARLRNAGLPSEDIHVFGPHPKKHNLVARLRTNGRQKPVLLLAHLDVVAAPRENWTVEPFGFLERDEHYYGRGTTDDKAMAAIWIATIIRLKEEAQSLDRDIIIALTADEEGGSHNGAKWLLAEHPELVTAEFGLNEGGYGRIRDGKRISNQIQASEKTPVFFDVVATGQAGHSSLPPADNAIMRLARALERIGTLAFPLQLTDVTRAFFTRMAEVEEGAVGDVVRRFVADPVSTERTNELAAASYFAGLLRTTCVATRIHAGHGDNVVPHSAHAVLDCRMLTGTSVAEVRQTIVSAIGDERVSVTPRVELEPAPASPLRPDLIQAVEQITESMWPGVPVVPVMSIGATDSAHFRRAGTPMYGLTGLFLDVNDTRAHGPDERVLVQSYHDAAEFQYRLVRALSASLH